MSRVFEGLTAFAGFLAEREVLMVPTVAGMARDSADILYKRAYDIYGDSKKLEDLAPATRAERKRLGFSPNDPLKRDGELLQESLEKGSTADGLAGIGSAEPVQKDHEFGYINARTGTAVPPRSVMRRAMSEAAPEIRELVNGTMSFVLGQSKPRLKF